jgi:hypothetical protein
VVFVGYEPGSKAWRFYNLGTKRMHVSRDAVFEEDMSWRWGNDEGGTMAGGEDPFRVEYVTIRDERPKAARVPNSPPAAPSLTPSQHSEGAPACGAEPSSPLSSPSPDMVEFVSPLMTTLDLDANADDAPRRFRAMWNILGVAPTSGIADRGIVQELLAAIEEEPGSTEEALEVKEWHTAMKEEMDSIQENKTWSPMHLPKGHRAMVLSGYSG